MGIFNWKKKKASLSNEENEELQKDKDLMSFVAAINAQNGSTKSPLESLPSFTRVPSLIYACKIGKMFMVKDAINNGSDINETDDDGTTPLHASCEEGNIEMVQFLLDFGADKNILNNKGILPIELAENKGHHSIVELLRN